MRSVKMKKKKSKQNAKALNQLIVHDRAFPGLIYVGTKGKGSFYHRVEEDSIKSKMIDLLEDDATLDDVDKAIRVLSRICSIDVKRNVYDIHKNISKKLHALTD